MSGTNFVCLVCRQEIQLMLGSPELHCGQLMVLNPKCWWCPACQTAYGPHTAHRCEVPVVGD